MLRCIVRGCHSGVRCAPLALCSSHSSSCSTSIGVGLSSDIRLFADDCIVYRGVNSSEDADALQSDLPRLVYSWQVRFNVKCPILHITTRKRVVRRFQYSINGDFLGVAQTSPTVRSYRSTLDGTLTFYVCLQKLIVC